MPNQHGQVFVAVDGPDKKVVHHCIKNIERVIKTETTRLLREADTKRTNTCFTLRTQAIRQAPFTPMDDAP